MNNSEFKKKLVQLGACGAALEWLGDQDPAAAWDAAGAVDFDWLVWLVCELPSLGPLFAEYEAKCDALWAEYDAKEALLWAEYEAKRAALWAKYDAKEALLFAEYEAKEAALWAEYDAKRAPLLAKYEAKRAPLFYSMFPWSVIEDALLKESVSV